MSRPSLVEEIFLAALEKPIIEERAAFLDGACRGDASLRDEVDRLLRAHPSAGRFLEPAEAADATADFASRDEKAGVVIAGRYKLLEPIGEGGMGSVWMAQQTEPVKRIVALKLIKEGMDTRAVLARFEAERQALALMDHPNIARVLDAGSTSDGRPFFVMELVKGVPITRYCDDRKLTLRQRLELFIPVCQAVQHAHQKGVIHRDLKPSNVLVAQYDDRPVPKVIDFGVAKAAGQPLTDHTLVTGFGAVVGTPEYMSPEQAQFNQLDIDTRSDVYALGVLLYELLTGSTPFIRKEFEKAGLLEILRVIREQEPPRPSTRLSTAEALPTLAANRGSEPRLLAGLLKNDLDWVVMKAMEKDRNRRYETATGFAADVQRYLSGEAVQAHPPSTAYRMKKFAKKHKAALITAAAFVSLLIAAVGISAMLAVKARRAEVVAEENRTKAEANAEEASKSNELAALRYGMVLQATGRLQWELKNSELARLSMKTDSVLAEIQTDPSYGLLQLAGTLRDPVDLKTTEFLGINVDPNDLIARGRQLREFATMAILATGQTFAPLLPPITHDGIEVGDEQLNSTHDRLVTRGKDLTARLWDPSTHRQIAILHQADEKVIEFGFSPDGLTLFTHSLDGIVRIWESTDGAFRASTEPRVGRLKFNKIDPSNPLFELVISRLRPDITLLSNSRLLTSSLFVTSTFSRDDLSPKQDGIGYSPDTSGPVELWDSRTGQLVTRIATNTDNGHSCDCEFFGEGRWIKSRNPDGHYSLLSSNDGRSISLPHDEKHDPFFVDRISISPSGKALASVVFREGNAFVYNWNVEPLRLKSVTGPLPTKDLGRVTFYAISDDLFVLNDYMETRDVFRFGVVRMIGSIPDGPVHIEFDRMVFDTGTIFDATTMKRLRPPKGRKYHPDLARFAPDGRFISLTDSDAQNPLILVDSIAEKSIRIQGFRPIYQKNKGWLQVGGVLDRLPPPNHLNIPPDLLELWAKVAVRGELDDEGVFVKWNEETWEKHRQELASKPAPYPDFPFPGYVATDRLHWLRKEYEAASEADKPRLARQLLDRAEAAGDRSEATRWRAVLAPPAK